MPSKKKQVNVRLDADSEAKLAALAERMHAALNIKVSQADVVTAALAELEKRYPPEPKSRRGKAGA